VNILWVYSSFLFETVMIMRCTKKNLSLTKKKKKYRKAYWPSESIKVLNDSRAHNITENCNFPQWYHKTKTVMAGGVVYDSHIHQVTPTTKMNFFFQIFFKFDTVITSFLKNIWIKKKYSSKVLKIDSFGLFVIKALRIMICFEEFADKNFPKRIPILWCKN